MTLSNMVIFFGSGAVFVFFPFGSPPPLPFPPLWQQQQQTSLVIVKKMNMTKHNDIMHTFLHSIMILN
jgi:hypothetical protein